VGGAKRSWPSALSLEENASLRDRAGVSLWFSPSKLVAQPAMGHDQDGMGGKSQQKC